MFLFLPTRRAQVGARERPVPFFPHVPKGGEQGFFGFDNGRSFPEYISVKEFTTPREVKFARAKAKIEQCPFPSTVRLVPPRPPAKYDFRTGTLGDPFPSYDSVLEEPTPREVKMARAKAKLARVGSKEVINIYSCSRDKGGLVTNPFSPGTFHPPPAYISLLEEKDQPAERMARAKFLLSRLDKLKNVVVGKKPDVTVIAKFSGLLNPLPKYQSDTIKEQLSVQEEFEENLVKIKRFQRKLAKVSSLPNLFGP